MVNVCVRISLWLKLQRSDEPVPAGGLQSTLCHVRAAGSGLTRCPGSRRLCPAACERRWHKACPAESPVCSLCLPFSPGHYLRLQKEASWHQVDEPLCLSSLSLLPFTLLSRPQKRSIYLNLGQLRIDVSRSELAPSLFSLKP